MKTNAEKRACERHTYTRLLRFHISIKEENHGKTRHQL